MSALLLLLQIFSAHSAPLVRLSQVHLDKTVQTDLQKAIATRAPGLVLVVDSKRLKVLAFLNGDGTRSKPSDYLLVDVISSSNGIKGHETPEGLFLLDANRMKEKDRSWTWGIPMHFTLFWKDYFSKENDGVAFHQATRTALEKIGIACASHGCVGLREADAKRLFNEVKKNFSAQRNGSDVLILSALHSGSGLPSEAGWKAHFNDEQSYHDRWLDLHETHNAPVIESLPPELEAISTTLMQESILIDTRKPIAGNGDTASTLYLVESLFARGYTGQLDILVDDRSERIFNTLSARRFQKNIRLLKTADLEAKVYSLVLRSGQPSGRIFNDSLNETSSELHAAAGKINFDKKTIFMTFTIYGNSRNSHSVQPFSIAAQGDSFYTLPATGLDINRDAANVGLSISEAGIFRDPFSLSIRNWSIEKIEDYLEQASDGSRTFALFKRLAQLRKTQDLPYSLAYGFSIPQVKTQARDYFRSLLSLGRPTVVVTPSAFSAALFNSFRDDEKTQIQVLKLSDIEEYPSLLGTRKLTIVQVPNLPHRQFAALALASFRNRIVPLGAGDGFFTTALSLGIPFAPTIVEWNIRNVRALARVLQLAALNHGFDSSYRQNLRRVYSAIPSDPIQLGFSQSLLRYAPLFQEALFAIPDLMKTIDSIVVQLRDEKNPRAELKPLMAEKAFVLKPIAQNEPTETEEKHGKEDGGKKCIDALQ